MNSKQINDKRVAAERANALAGIAWMSEERPVWSCGTPVHPADQYRMIVTWKLWLSENAYRWTTLTPPPA